MWKIWANKPEPFGSVQKTDAESINWKVLVGIMGPMGWVLGVWANLEANFVKLKKLSNEHTLSSKCNFFRAMFSARVRIDVWKNFSFSFKQFIIPPWWWGLYKMIYKVLFQFYIWHSHGLHSNLPHLLYHSFPFSLLASQKNKGDSLNQGPTIIIKLYSYK